MYPGIAFGSIFGADGAGKELPSIILCNHLLREHRHCSRQRG